MDKIIVNKEIKIIGVAASPGISIGKALIYRKPEFAATGILVLNERDVQEEIHKFELAVKLSVDEVEEVKKKEGLKTEELEILESHLEFLTDPQIRENVLENISMHRMNVADAVFNAIEQAVQLFNNMEDEYLRARAADVNDIGNRILQNLQPDSKRKDQVFPANSIIIADDISPSDAIGFDLNLVAGFATRTGGTTSHTAILAKSKNIPAIVGCGNALKRIVSGDTIIIDGETGFVILHPTQDSIETYNQRKQESENKTKRLLAHKDSPALTTDGIEIELLANISNAADLESSFEFGAKGAGLFRTELLFMNRSAFPTEEEQYEFYKEVAFKSKGKPVTVRTIDIGGDKPLDYFKLPKEENPFLGYRAIRICLDQQEIFITQLKAILRAAVFGNFRLMFPMISSLQELRQAKQLLQSAKSELLANEIPFRKDIQVGMMIEVPSAAIIADLLAKEVDFFSIGTNDLCQYTLAVDRMNEKIRDLYDPYNPAVLRLISFTIEQANKHGINVAICGEFAADPRSTLLLLGLGLKEFSMSAVSIPIIKNIINQHSALAAREISQKVMAMDNSKSILNFLQSTYDFQ